MTGGDPTESAAAAIGGDVLVAPAATRAQRLLARAPLGAILHLAAPTTLVMLIAALSNVLYTYYVSRLGPDAIAAVSLVFPVSLLVTTAMAGGIGAGASSAIARALGAHRRREAARIAEHGVMLAAALGVTFGLAMIAGAPAAFRLMGGKAAVLELAVSFARVLFSGAAITFAASMLDSVLRGEGNVRVPTIWSSTSLLLQIVLTPLFMFTGGLGLAGAAVAMLAAQLIALLPRARHVLGPHGLLRDAAWPPRLAASPLLAILRVGIPASLSTTVANLGLMILTGVVGHLGTAHLAAYGLGTRLDFVFLTVAYGFGAAVLTLVGMAAGARRPDLVQGYARRGATLAFALLAPPSALLWWRPALWLGIFTRDPEILAAGTHYLRLIGPTYPFVAISMVLAFAFQGLGRATTPLVLMVVRTVAVLVAAVVCTRWLGLGDRAVFATLAAANLLSSALMSALFARARRGDQKLYRPPTPSE